MRCSLCQARSSHHLITLRQKNYWQCPDCTLTFLDPADHLSNEAERAEYERHQNSPEDQGYRRFLHRLTDHLLPHLTPGMHGLDYGSGPGPTLPLILLEHGFSMDIYDPYFAPQIDVLTQPYDFITCTETIEHFYHPDQEFKRLNTLLKPGGWLGIMTETMLDNARFATWWYNRDPTHVCFYKHETMSWLARRFDWRMLTPRKNVFLYQKLTKSKAKLERT